MMHDALKRYFDEQGISQQQIANTLDVSLQYVNQILNGKKALGKKNAERLSNLYGLSKPFLLTGEGELVAINEQSKVENDKPTNPTIAEPAGFGNFIELFSRTIRESDDLRVELKKNLAEVKALKDDLHQAVYDFRDATYRLTQALEQLNKNSSNIKPLNIAAEDDNQ